MSVVERDAWDFVPEEPTIKQREAVGVKLEKALEKATLHKPCLLWMRNVGEAFGANVEGGGADKRQQGAAEVLVEGLRAARKSEWEGKTDFYQI